MNLKEFLSIEPKQKFKPKSLWSLDGGMFYRDHEAKYRLVLSEAKWKAKPAEPGKPYAMCVYLNKKGRVVFQYDPGFMSRIMENPKWFKSLLRHEVMHVVLGHLTYRIPEDKDQYRWNIATDLAINSILCGAGKFMRDIPDFWVVPGRDEFYGLGHNLSAEVYYDLIKDMKLPKDEHAKFNKRSNAKRDRIFKETSRSEFEKIKEELTYRVFQGSMQPEYNEYVITQKHDAVVVDIPQLSALLLRITKLKATDFTSTRRVRNKRYPEYPGKKVEREPEPVVMLVDWSESISDEQLVTMDRFIRTINKDFPIVYVPFTDGAEWAFSKTYQIGVFRSTVRDHVGMTDINGSLQSVYAKYPSNDQIVVVVSDFNDDDHPIVLVKKNVFGVNTRRLTHHVNDHPQFFKKMYQIC